MCVLLRLSIQGRRPTVARRYRPWRRGVVRQLGLKLARHLRGEIYEVRAEGDNVAYRILFAPEGARSQVLLSRHAFVKKSQKTRPADIRLAETRLADWRLRGAATTLKPTSNA